MAYFKHPRTGTVIESLLPPVDTAEPTYWIGDTQIDPAKLSPELREKFRIEVRHGVEIPWPEVTPEEREAHLAELITNAAV